VTEPVGPSDPIASPEPEAAAPLSVEPPPAPPPAPSVPEPPPVLVTRALHARDAAGERGASRGRLAGVDLTLGPGVHAILGSPEDGTLALHDVVTGARAPVRGLVRVGGFDPAASPFVRARIGALADDPWLPAAPTVGAALELVLRARGDRDGAARDLVARLGLLPLLGRRPHALAYPEARALELALALSTPSPLLLALHEPFAEVATGALAEVRARIAELGAAGACVLVTTSSTADARALAERVLVLGRGLVRAGVDAPGRVAGELCAFVAAADSARVRELAGALAGHPEVQSLAWDEGGPRAGARLVVRGGDLAACAVALADAAVATGVELEAVTPGPAPRAEP
jgi:ABC-2 type transport system ATP-binding protein